MSAREAGYQLGYAAFPVILLAIAAYVGLRMGKRRQPPKFVFWPVGLAAILLVLGFLGNLLRKTDSATPTSEIR
jgi:hypothetical protein